MRLLWTLTFIAVVGSGIAVFCDLPPILSALFPIMAGILLILLWFATVLPVKKAAIGIELIRSEEYNNRLTPSREPGANRIVGVFNNLMDKLSEERTRLLEINNLLNLLVKASPMGVAIMDFDYRFSLVNEAFTNITGFNESDLIGESPGRLPFTSPLLNSIATLKNGEETTVRGGGTEIYRVSRLSFVENGFQRPFILIEKLTDEIRRAEKEAYGRVVRTISHEVNNSMGGLLSFLDSLTELQDLQPDMRELAESCSEACQQLVEFIRGYADIVKIGDPILHEVDYNEVIRRETPFLRTIVPSGIMLETSLCDGVLPIEIDRAMMRQALVNLVKNAAESIEESGNTDGRILITTRIEHHKGIIEIEDNGKGLSSSDTELIFNPFHTTKPNGQGLGLTLTAEVLRRHCFQFSLTTVAPRRTIFRVAAPTLRK